MIGSQVPYQNPTTTKQTQKLGRNLYYKSAFHLFQFMIVINNKTYYSRQSCFRKKKGKTKQTPAQIKRTIYLFCYSRTNIWLNICEYFCNMNHASAHCTLIQYYYYYYHLNQQYKKKKEITIYCTIVW
jgi:hypothetical protein